MAVRKRETKRYGVVWDLIISQGRNKPSIFRSLPHHIKTKEEALLFVKSSGLDDKSNSYINGSANKSFEYYLNSYQSWCESNYTKSMFLSVKSQSIFLYKFFIRNKLNLEDFISPSPNFFVFYINERKKEVDNFKLLKELKFIVSFNKFFVNEGFVKELHYDPVIFYPNIGNKILNDFSEIFFQNVIRSNPEKFIGENLKVIKRKGLGGKLIPDIIFEDTQGNITIIEVQKLKLDRSHCYKILEYRDLIQLKLKIGSENIRMIVLVIGGECRDDRKMFLSKYGIEVMEISIKEFEDYILELL